MTHPTHTTRIVLVALVAPLLVALAALAVSFSVASTLPDRVAVHWNAAGAPDGYGSPYTFPILIALTCLPLDAILGGIVVLTSHRTPMTVMTKILAVVTLWTTVLVSVTLGGTLVAQHGSPSPAHASIVSLPIGAIAATILAVGAWFLLPKAVRAERDGGTPVAPVALGVHERASWMRTATASPGLIWAFIGLIVFVTAIVLISVFESDDRAWPVTFIPIVVLLIVLANFAWTVRVDARGVRIRSTIGIPTITIPIATIESASVIRVQALAEYGGYGFRWGLNGRFGVILRSGEALEVERRSGRSVVVTVDDATSAAALINALVARSAATTQTG